MRDVLFTLLAVGFFAVVVVFVGACGLLLREPQLLEEDRRR
jgi:hypothetical protein